MTINLNPNKLLLTGLQELGKEQLVVDDETDPLLHRYLRQGSSG